MPTPKLNPGKVRCLGPDCGKLFDSRDRATNRLCQACTRKRGYAPRVRKVTRGGGSGEE